MLLKPQTTTTASQQYEEAVTFVEKEVARKIPNKTHTQDCQIDDH